MSDTRFDLQHYVDRIRRTIKKNREIAAALKGGADPRQLDKPVEFMGASDVEMIFEAAYESRTQWPRMYPTKNSSRQYRMEDIEAAIKVIHVKTQRLAAAMAATVAPALAEEEPEPPEVPHQRQRRTSKTDPAATLSIEDLRRTPLSELGFSSQHLLALNNAGMLTIYDLQRYLAQGQPLESIRYIGKTTAKNIIEVLEGFEKRHNVPKADDTMAPTPPPAQGGPSSGSDEPEEEEVEEPDTSGGGEAVNMGDDIPLPKDAPLPK